MSDYVNYNKLYKKLTYQLKVIDEYFSNISGESIMGKELEALAYAVEYDMFVNGLCILINLFENNSGSYGIDVNMRDLLESLSLTKAIVNNELSDGQIALALEARNYTSCEKLSYIYGFDIQVIIEENITKIRELLNISKEQVIKDFNTQFSFLKYGDKTKKMTASQFIEKQSGKDARIARHFSSLNIHPAFYSYEINKTVEELRNVYINLTLQTLDRYMNNVNADYEKMPSYSASRKKAISPEMDNKINNIKKIFKKTFAAKDNYSFSGECATYVFKKVKEVLIDIYLCSNFLSLEEASSRFKIIYEYLSMFYAVKDDVNLMTLWQMVSDYNISTTDEEFHMDSDALLKDIAMIVKTKHSLDNKSLEDVKNELKKNSLYFLNADSKASYMQLVKKAIYGTYQVDSLKDRAYQLYRFSLNDAHGGLSLVKSAIKINSLHTKRKYFDYVLNYIYFVYYCCVLYKDQEKWETFANFIYSLFQDDN